MRVNQWLKSTRQGAAQKASSGAPTRPHGHWRLQGTQQQPSPVYSAGFWWGKNIETLQQCHNWQQQHTCMYFRTVVNLSNWQGFVLLPCLFAETLRFSTGYQPQTPGLLFEIMVPEPGASKAQADGHRDASSFPCSWPGSKVPGSGEDSWRGSKKSSARKGAHHGGGDWTTTASTSP